MALSNPDIIDATGYFDPLTNESFAMWLWKNSGGYGYARFEFYDPSGNLISAASDCFQTSANLNYLTIVEITTANVINSFNIAGLRCATETDQSCPAGVCVNRVQTASLNNRPVRSRDTTIPNSPTNLIITPGDGQLTTSWQAVTNVDVFAYHVKISQGADTITDGYTLSSELSSTQAGLTNGVTYNIEVSAVSSSNERGLPSTGSGIPGVSTTGSITFTSNPPVAEIFIDDVDQGKQTPIKIENVPIGTHTYTLKLGGFPDAQGTVNVLAGQDTPVTVDFTGQGNTLLLVGGIAVAAVVIGGVIYYYTILNQPPRQAQTFAQMPPTRRI